MMPDHLPPGKADRLERFAGCQPLALWLAQRFGRRFSAAVLATHGLDLADLIAESHLALWRAAGRFDPAHGSAFPAYASTAIQHALTSLWQRTRPLGADPLPERRPDPASGLDLAAVEASDFWSWLARQLSPRQRQLLEWRFLEGRTLADIGQRLGRSHEGARQLVKRVVRRLRTALERLDGP
jgi:RNA polymerase sigma factor (sigma-70 family)